MRFKIFITFIVSHAILLAGLQAYGQANSAPSINYASPKIYTINAPIAPLQPSNGGGPVAPGGFSIDQPLPAGLSLDANTGVISGTPTALSPATIYTVTAINNIGPSKATLNIKVSNEDVGVPKAPNLSYPPQVYQVNVPISPLAPVSNGGAVKRYSIGLLRDYAGTGSAGRLNGALNASQFDMPFRTVIAPDGTMYIADFNNYAVRKISNGQVSSFAGEAGQGYANGSFGQAQLQGPTGIAVDSKGNVFVADVFSIRKITPSGIVSTLAGNNISGYVDAAGGAARFNSATSIAIDAQNNIYVADQNNFAIRKITPAGIVTTVAGNGFRGNQDGQGSAAAFNSPQDLIFYNGYLLVADQLAIRKVTLTGDVTTVAGNGTRGVRNGPVLSAGFGNASAIAVNSFGDIYILDIGSDVPNEGSCVLRRIENGTTVTSVDIADANGNKIYLTRSNGIMFNKENLMYLAASDNFIHTLRFDSYRLQSPLPAGLVFDEITGVISGTPTAVTPQKAYPILVSNAGGTQLASAVIEVRALPPLPLPPDIAYQSPQRYVIGSGISPLVPSNKGGPIPIDGSGTVVTHTGTGSAGNMDGPSGIASFYVPTSLTADGSGNLYFTDLGNLNIKKIDAAGFVTTIAGSGQKGVINGTGKAASFASPLGLVADKAGNLYVSESLDHIIRKITLGGQVTTFAGIQSTPGNVDGAGNQATFSAPNRMAIDKKGNIYVVSGYAIRKIAPDATVTTFAGSDVSGPADGVGRAASFTSPLYITADAFDNIYVTDMSGRSLRKITPDGTVSTIDIVANGVVTITGLTADNAGNIYISDSGSHKIFSRSKDGTVRVFAGTGEDAMANGTLQTSKFGVPTAMAFDSQGYLYVIDSEFYYLKKITINGFYINKSLPKGLNFDSSTGIISGTPEELLPPTSYTITAYNAYGSSAAQVLLEVRSGFFTFDPIPQKFICSADFSLAATNTSPITFISSNPNVATVINGMVHITGAGNTDITATSNGENITRNLIVNDMPSPTIRISSAQPVPACENLAEFKFKAEVTNAPSGANYQWRVNYIPAGTNSPDFNTTALTNGDEVTCTVTTQGDCILTATSEKLVIKDIISAPQATQSLNITSNTAEITAGKEVVFTATPSDPSAVAGYQWQLNGNSISGAVGTVFATTTLKDGDIVTCVMTLNILCATPVTSNQISINVLPPPIIAIANTFTPNDDGKNDTWVIPALSAYPHCLVQVFNRYGQMVMTSRGYNKPWNGTNAGKPLPSGVYYYIINTNDGQSKFSGNVTILR